MASKSKSRVRKPKPSQSHGLGLFDIPDLDSIDNVSDDSDCDLESELANLLSGKEPVKRQKAKPAVTPVVDIEKLAADCLNDPDDIDDEDDNDLSGDEDILKELQELSTDDAQSLPQIPVSEEKQPELNSSHTPSVHASLLEERLLMYNEALQAAERLNDLSKIRRYKRALQTLKNQIKEAKVGKCILEEDVPPPVKIAAEKKPIPEDNQDFSPSPVDIQTVKLDTLNIATNDSHLLTDLMGRRDEYKKAALQAKKDGDKNSALEFLRIVKKFNCVIEAVKGGQAVDLSNIPPPMAAYSATVSASVPKAHEKISDNIQSSSDFEKAALAAAEDAEPLEIFAAPPAPSTILEALQQRLDKYSLTKEAAFSEGNTSKVRRLQRIVKQYESAIKDFKAGKEIDYESLPAPPGFGPIPLHTLNAPIAKSTRNLPLSDKKIITEKHEDAEEKPSPAAPASMVKPKLQRAATITDKTHDFLLERQKLFREAALAAKKAGDIQQAKEYLRMSKGFDSMIEACKCGLPLDISTIPTPPQLESDFIIVSKDDCVQNDDSVQDLTFETLEKDLRHQVDVCSTNKEHFLRLGDVSTASKFEKLLLETKKDLSVIQHMQRTGAELPRFHYETRMFSIVQCNTDLSDEDFEVTVERGINLPGKPNVLNTFVKIDLAIPSDSPQTAKTSTIRDTENPMYQTTTKFTINRKSRATQRAFKRQTMKFEVWTKGGFLRSDTLIGTVLVKLADLESKCVLHDSYNLVLGRKAVGGMLEIKLRLREPLLVKQVEEVREKWLVIGT